MFNWLNSIDTSLFLFLNGKHNAFWDVVMYWSSNKLTWLPVYLLLIYLVVKHYRRQSWIVVLFVALLIALTDQISVQLFKEIFHRLRPCHQPALEGLVHLVRGKCGGDYGFISSHACNYFGIALFLIGMLGKRVRYFIPLILFWAAWISYSRIYLGVHFPGDVLTGGLVGALIGCLLAQACKWALGRVKISL